jgi:hypothetical protein
MLDTTKAKLHGMSIFLAKGAMELRFGSMSFKEMRSTFAIRITLGNTGRSNKLRSSYGRSIQRTRTLTTIQRLRLKRRSRSGLEEANLEASTSE